MPGEYERKKAVKVCGEPVHDLGRLLHPSVYQGHVGEDAGDCPGGGEVCMGSLSLRQTGKDLHDGGYAGKWFLHLLRRTNRYAGDLSWKIGFRLWTG